MGIEINNCVKGGFILSNQCISPLILELWRKLTNVKEHCFKNPLFLEMLLAEASVLTFSLFSLSVMHIN